MDAFDVIGLLLPAVEKVGNRIIGYNEQIRKKFNRALEKALSANDELYINNAKVHLAELIGLILLVMDEPSSINSILLPNYISRDEFRSFYAETEKDKDLCQVLKDEWIQYKAKDTNNQVKAILDLIVKLNDEKKEDRTIWKSLQTAVGQLVERFDALQDEKDGKNVANAPSLGDCLLKKLKQKRDNHPSFKLMDIEDDLFPDGMITFEFETEALDSDDQLKRVKDIVEESWNKPDRNHLMIEGIGGIGKTVTLLSLPDKFAPHYVPAVYIPLHELQGETSTIEKYIKGQVLDYNDREVRYGELMDVVEEPWDKGPRFLLLLDGFNEITNERRVDISRDIEHWSERPGVQIITSSRYDIRQYVALGANYSKIELQELTPEKVTEYLQRINYEVPANQAVMDLIRTPLLLTLYIKTQKSRICRQSPLAEFRENQNAGLLIWNYLQSELWRYRGYQEESKACVLAMEFIAPYIAWNMQQHTSFVLNEDVFLGWMEEAYRLLNDHFGNSAELPKHINNTVRLTSSHLPEYELIRDLLKEQLSLFNKQERKDENNERIVEYRLMHQQFRDALAAMHLINLSYLSGDSLQQKWNTPIDHYVMQFVANLISEKEAIRLWEQNRKTPPAQENATINQLRLQGWLHHNDFSHLDFSRLDLSNISLYPYRYGKATLKLPTQKARMVETKISKKTFSPEGHEGVVTAITVTPDGKRIVSGSHDRTIRVWDMETGAAIGNTLEGHKGWVNAVAVTLDGKRIVSGSDDHTIRVWDLETGAAIGKPIKGHKNVVTAVAVTPDGKRIVSGSRDNTIRVWDMETGAAIGNSIEGHEGWVNAVVVTPDGKRIVSGSSDHTIRVWDMETDAAIGKPIEGHEGVVYTVAVTQDGKRIVSGYGDNIIRVWDLETGAAIGKPIKGHKSRVATVAVTQDGKRIVSGAVDGTIRVWDMETGAAIGSLIKGHKSGVTAVAVTPDGKRIVSGSDDCTIRVWDIETGVAIGMPIEGHIGVVNAVAVTLDGERIVSACDDCTIRVWDIETGTAIGRPIEGHNGQVRAVAVTPDGKRIVSRSGDRTIRVWDLETGAAIGNPIEGRENLVAAVAVTPDGKRIVSGSWDHTIRVWDLETGAVIGNPIEGHVGAVYAVAVTPDGKRIVSSSSDHTIRMWDMETGAAIGKPIEGHECAVNAVAVMPDGKHIVGRYGINTIRVWNLETGATIKKLIVGREFGVTTNVTLTLDGRHIISRSGDSNIRVWDVETGAAIGKPIKGHEIDVTTVAAMPDRKRIVSRLRDGTICIIDIETREVKRIKIHPLSFIGLDFSLADISDPELKETLRQNGAKV